MCISHEHLDAVSCPDFICNCKKTTQDTLFLRVACKTGAFGGNPIRLSHLSRYVALIGKGASLTPPTPTAPIWIFNVCFGVRALKAGQRHKALHRKETKTPWKIPQGYRVWSWYMEFVSTGFWVSLHLDENTAQSQTIDLMSYSQKKKKKRYARSNCDSPSVF